MIKRFLFGILSVSFLFSSSLFSGEKSMHLPIQEKVYPVVILGGGVGGLTASIYLSRSGVSPLVIEKGEIGGAIGQSFMVENWPGEIAISGKDLSDKIYEQARKNQVEFLKAEITKVDLAKDPIQIDVKTAKGVEKKIFAKNCIIALGSKPNSLKIPGEKFYFGKGVSTCAVCDGALYQDKEVAVIGGGEAAIAEALYLSNIASKVYLIYRKEDLRYHDTERKIELLNNQKIKLLPSSIVEEFYGDNDRFTHLFIKNVRDNKVDALKIDGAFLAIGYTPNSELFASEINRDEKGYIIVDENQKTSKDHVYAIGDITQRSSEIKQAIFSAAQGAKAALEVQKNIPPDEIKKQKSKEIVKMAVEEKEKIPPSFASQKTKTKEIGYANKSGYENRAFVEIQSLDQFEKVLKEAKLPVLLDFYASWCPPCSSLSAKLKKEASLYTGKAIVCKVNVQKVPKLAKKYKIASLPTVILFDSKNKNVTKKETGIENISSLLNDVKGTHLEAE